MPRIDQAKLPETAQRILFLLTLTLICLRLGHGQDDLMLAESFENGVSGWMTFDAQAGVEAVSAADKVKSGKGALEFRYPIREGGMPMLVRTGASITSSASLEFYVKCSHATGLVFGVAEANQARYGAMAYVSANAWTRIAVNLDELQLAEDSTDSNGMLEAGQVESVWIVDVGSFAQMFAPEIRGERRLWLDDLKFSRKAVTASREKRTVGSETHTVIDSFNSELLRWIPATVTFNPVKFTLFPSATYQTTSDVPDGGGKAALKVSYPRPPLGAFLLMRDLNGIRLGGSRAVTFWIRVDSSGTFLANLEKTNGARYQQSFSVDPGKWTKIELALNQFRLADDSNDPEAKLNLDKVKQFSILDTNLQMQDAGQNTMYLDELTFVSRD